MDSKGVKMQIYNIETKAIISGEEIKELDDCWFISNGYLERAIEDYLKNKED